MEILKIKKRYDFIDLLKTVAIFFVLIYHLSLMNVDFIKSDKFICYFNYYFKSILSTCVPIFFFVNGGLLMNKSNLDIKDHTKKIIKIIILTIIWGIITLLSFSVIRNEPLSIKEIIKGVFTLKQGWINHLWYLEALVVIYIFYPLFYNTFKTSKKHLYFFLICVFILTFFNTFIGALVNILNVFLEKNNQANFNPVNYFSAFNAFNNTRGYSIVYFLLGGILFYYKEKINTKWFMLASLISLPISMFLLFWYGVKISENKNNIWDIVFKGYDSIFTLLNVVALFILSLNYTHKGIIGKTIRLVAENSLGIYLIHLIIGALLSPYFYLTGIIGTIIFATIILFISLFIALLLKKIPVIKNLVSLG